MSESKLFYLDEYLDAKREAINIKDQAYVNKLDRFLKLCNEIENEFDKDWEIEQGKGNEASDLLLEYQKKAIIGYQKEVNFFKTRIKEYLKNNNLMNEYYPSWYDNLINAIFEEIWGVAGIYKWKTIKESSSAKIIGERIYYLIDGKMQLQPQKISYKRYKRLVTSLLLRTPQIRLNAMNYAEVYMLDGTRITIYSDNDNFTKEPTIVFRKYIVQDFNFEEQANRKTIDKAFVKGIKELAATGFNVNIIGPVRTGKTTLLQTWQKYEDETLEGVTIETDPEIPFNVLMPNAPIMQIVADGDKLKNIIKELMRSDADYFILAEARDATALYIQMMVTAKGTRRVKSTYHSSDPIDFCYDAASEIVREFGGDIFTTAIKVAKGYHYLIELCQLKDKSQKRLKGIYELRYDPINIEITIHQIVKYDFDKDDWTYKYDIGTDKEEIALQEGYEHFKVFKKELKRLAEEKPMQGPNVFKPSFTKFIKG